MFSLDLGILLDIVTILVAVGAAWILIRSRVCQQTEQELKDLAEARKEKITDLETAMAELKGHVQRLEGRVEGIMAIKSTEIADMVVDKTVDIMSAKVKEIHEQLDMIQDGKQKVRLGQV